MEVMFLLVPLSVLAVLAILCVFAWAVGAGQFDDLEGEGLRIFDATDAALDADQADADVRIEKSLNDVAARVPAEIQEKGRFE